MPSSSKLPMIPPGAPKKAASAVMSLGDHLDELRTRLIHTFAGLIPFFLISLFFGQNILAFLIHPLQEQLRAAGLRPALLATNVLELFNTYLRISIIMTILVGAPWALWQIWRFVAPGLYAHERRFVYVLLPLSTLLTVAGCAFLYLVILPAILTFFINFGTGLGRPTVTMLPMPEGAPHIRVPVLHGDLESPKSGDLWVNTELQQLRVFYEPKPGAGVFYGADLTKGAGVEPQYRISEYVSLLTNLALAFSVAFQLPVVVLLLGWARILTIDFLCRNRKYAFFICTVIAAGVTPGDMMSMILLMFPLYLLYEFGIILLRVLPASRVAGDTSARESDAAGDA
jgi:sec-independent protein translocase protein TatC